MIEINNLKKTYSDLCVLENINLKIEDGDIYGLVGKSGAGKSTLLHCINGLETYNSGSLKVNGIEVSKLDKNSMRLFRKEISMIFQHFNLMSRKTVYENIAFPMRCWKYNKANIDKKVMELAEIVGITDKLGQKPNSLSGGQKQRVAIARALSMDPKILLSDEATSALDPTTTQSILQLLKEINERTGITIIIVTHQMAVVRKICHKVSLLQKGRLVVSGPVEELFLNSPRELRQFIGEEDTAPLAGGVTLQIMLLDDDGSNAVFSSMAHELGVNFRIVGGRMESYRDKHLGAIIVNFQTTDADRIEQYLDNRCIRWHHYEPINLTEGEEGCIV